MSVNLPTSIGEAVDKLNILDIKSRKISDEKRLQYVKSEYKVVHDLLEPYLSSIKFYYIILNRVNEHLWELQDDLRLNAIPSSNDICKLVLDENDRRCRIKNKINSKIGSSLREQKGYPLKRAFVISHMGLGDMICMIGIVRYLSTIYDEVEVAVKENYLSNIKLFYQDDDTIKFRIIDDPNKYVFKNESMIDNNTKVYCCGYHSDIGWQVNYNNTIPEIFYQQMGFDYKTAQEYFYIDTTHFNNDKLLKEITDKEYIFVHDSSSTENKSITEKLIDNCDMLIINPNKNPYQLNTGFDEYFRINKLLQNKPIAYFIPIMMNAKEIHCVDSSFFNLANFVDTTKVERLVCYPRDNTVYPNFNKFEYVY
jgi:hypothetical protein